jgi:hypothetical protein
MYSTSFNTFLFNYLFILITIYVFNLHKGDQLCHHLNQMIVKLLIINTILHFTISCAILSHCCEPMILSSCRTPFSCLPTLITSRISSLLGSFSYILFYFILLVFIIKLLIFHIYLMSSMLSMCRSALPAPVLPCNCLLKTDPP